MSNVSNVASSLLTGLTVSLFMYGVATAQTCYYFSHYASDPTRLKSRVTVLWILSTTFIILLTLSVYMDVILRARTGYLSPSITWTVPIYLAYVTSLSTASLVQIDFLYKIHKLNSPKWRLPVSCLLGCAILTRLAFGIVAMRSLGKEFLSPADVHLSQSHHPVIDKESPFNRAAVIIFLTSTIISDVTITTLLCTLFRPGDIISRGTQFLVVKLTLFALRRCVIVSLLSFLELGFLLAPASKRMQATFFSLEATVGAVYVTSFLTNLNARQYLRDRSVEPTTLADAGTEIELCAAGIPVHGALPAILLPSWDGSTSTRSPLSRTRLAWHEILWGGW